MTKSEIEPRCRQKADELLEKYFPNFIREAALDKPETLSVDYNDQLPGKVEDEFRAWLAGVWAETEHKSSRSFGDIMDRHLSMTSVDAEFVPLLEKARKEAERITVIEKLKKSNHQQVTYYKGLLRQYSQELLKTMIKDFVEEF